jgi:ArsR family transcriptional regulator, arsenate/arsenite/antimonite-responsive transcriptional repressor
MSSCCAAVPAPRLKHATHLVRLYQALADPTRLRILAMLAERQQSADAELCVCHIHDGLDVSQPTASRHLAYLRRAGLVDARRDGVWMHYRLVRPHDPVVASVFDAALHALGHVDSTPRDRARLQRVTQGHTPA